MIACGSAAVTARPVLVTVRGDWCWEFRLIDASLIRRARPCEAGFAQSVLSMLPHRGAPDFQEHRVRDRRITSHAVFDVHRTTTWRALAVRETLGEVERMTAFASEVSS